MGVIKNLFYWLLVPFKWRRKLKLALQECDLRRDNMARAWDKVKVKAVEAELDTCKKHVAEWMAETAHWKSKAGDALAAAEAARTEHEAKLARESKEVAKWWNAEARTAKLLAEVTRKRDQYERELRLCQKPDNLLELQAYAVAHPDALGYGVNAFVAEHVLQKLRESRVPEAVEITAVMKTSVIRGIGYHNDDKDIAVLVFDTNAKLQDVRIVDAKKTVLPPPIVKVTEPPPAPVKPPTGLWG